MTFKKPVIQKKMEDFNVKLGNMFIQFAGVIQRGEKDGTRNDHHDIFNSSTNQS
jgi:hypothetical protein